MLWDHRRGMWLCAHWPDCTGAGFNCDLHDAEPSPNEGPADGRVSLKEAANYFPRRRGKKVHYSTLHRWATKGVRGRILETQRVGGVLFTSLDAIDRFIGTSRTSRDEHERRAAIKRLLYGKAG